MRNIRRTTVWLVLLSSAIKILNFRPPSSAESWLDSPPTELPIVKNGALSPTNLGCASPSKAVAVEAGPGKLAEDDICPCWADCASLPPSMDPRGEALPSELLEAVLP